MIFLSLPIGVENPPRVYEEPLSLALERNPPSIYESMYVVLARRFGADPWTADRRLLQVVGGLP